VGKLRQLSLGRPLRMHAPVVPSKATCRCGC
jgi:hypothetical protein